MTTETVPATTTVTHGTFTLERTYPYDRATVFAAWASRDVKNDWFGEGDDFLATTTRFELDFRVGGRELLKGLLPSGKEFVYDSSYRDIVPDRRIVADYDVLVNGRKISVSVMTVEFLDAAGGTELILTEQGAFLDGFDNNDERQLGATDMLDQLTHYLETHAA